MMASPLTGFIWKRLAGLPLIILGVSMITFVLVRLVPVEPAEVIVRLSNIPASEEAIAALREELGTDRPLPVQYMLWLKEVSRFQFGTSYVSKTPVAAEISDKFPATLQLAFGALLLTLLVSVPLGVLSALYKDSLIDHFSRLLSYIGASMPRFWLGFLLIYWFSLKLDWFPTQGKGTAAHLVLPSATLALAQIAVFTRLLRSGILDHLKEPYVTYAKVRGLRDRAILIRHVLKPSLLPVVTALGISTGNLLGGTVMVEQIFGWPGLGRYLIESIMNRDYPVIQCYVLLMAAVYVASNLIVDLLHYSLDPRALAREGR